MNGQEFFDCMNRVRDGGDVFLNIRGHLARLTNSIAVKNEFSLSIGGLQIFFDSVKQSDHVLIFARTGRVVGCINDEREVTLSGGDE